MPYHPSRPVTSPFRYMEMFDFLAESGVDEAVLNKSSVFDDALSFRFEELQLLDQVHIVLVKLMILVDVSEESPVIKVIDGILENGIGGTVAPEAVTKPGGKGLEGFVRGVIRRGI